MEAKGRKSKLAKRACQGNCEAMSDQIAVTAKYNTQNSGAFGPRKVPPRWENYPAEEFPLQCSLMFLPALYIHAYGLSAHTAVLARNVWERRVGAAAFSIGELSLLFWLCWSLALAHQSSQWLSCLSWLSLSFPSFYVECLMDVVARSARCLSTLTSPVFLKLVLFTWALKYAGFPSSFLSHAWPFRTRFALLLITLVVPPIFCYRFQPACLASLLFIKFQFRFNLVVGCHAQSLADELCDGAVKLVDSWEFLCVLFNKLDSQSVDVLSLIPCSDRNLIWQGSLLFPLDLCNTPSLITRVHVSISAR